MKFVLNSFLLCIYKKRNKKKLTVTVILKSNIREATDYFSVINFLLFSSKLLR